MSRTIRASFDTIDLAENAARGVMEHFPDVIRISMIDNRHLSEDPSFNMTVFPVSDIGLNNQSAISPVYYPFKLNLKDDPYIDAGYYEPMQRLDTVLKVSVPDEMLRSTENYLRSIGGREIEVIRDELS